MNAHKLRTPGYLSRVETFASLDFVGFTGHSKGVHKASHIKIHCWEESHWTELSKSLPQSPVVITRRARLACLPVEKEVVHVVCKRNLRQSHWLSSEIELEMYQQCGRPHECDDATCFRMWTMANSMIVVSAEVIQMLN